ncbi:tRNA (adenosine(37)-N6)-threonylcarbamoyltransferase complex ATPase subunit type 1 TsaE [Eggerthellaceae bacterium zg-1084]|uniref:tRNA threonylcarbamoyladenosine biosynthesis protein TsaE n=2 Tax=Berryella wangjianweii TaxID=2734634 RepID=A0A6M8J243_9ACTN|nr:tRNA (adenosine(37)-N6)-threonylcarbamoyltransferase complex ATPase subunit type 1 TsaE [Berryella wangjianweii]NPD32193.1 tRNA (adenosine(37)-N6)-threonylcarbamoyltransferase complex ATPase subunit type 1 TsaE [Eggerthellaceae bacterium zg-997]QKF08000.1 tRNA (adenosine(37)-N6)-threonylcarbamoyltransferase complex ATPase subunit type 1 TsaE [Berryella wangjianweii]
MRTCNTADDVRQLAGTLSGYLRPGDVVLMKGDLGAGKTLFVQGVAQSLGVAENVISPTFNILLSYHSGGLPLFHFDLYRLEDEAELEDIGFYETLDGDGACFVEWGEKFPGCLGYAFLEVDITIEDDESRRVRVHAYGQRARSLLTVWGSDSTSRLTKVPGDFS